MRPEIKLKILEIIASIKSKDSDIIDLKNYGLTAEEIKFFATKISKIDLSSVKHIDISNNPIGDDGCMLSLIQ